MAKMKKWSEMSKKEKVGGIIGLTVIVFVLIGVFGPSSDTNNAVNNAQRTNSGGSSDSNKSTPAKTESKPTIPTEYASALIKAGEYADTMHMSKQGVYDQLVSQYGEKFSVAAAKYAIDNVKADWNTNALAKAKDYQDTMHMSPAAIHDQLTSEAGEKFTQAEADYAIQHLND